MSEIVVATLADVPRLSELLTVLFSQEAEFRPDPAKQAAGLRKIIEQPEAGHILVLREDGAIVAMVNLLYTVSTALGRRVAILEDMVVEPARRGSGAGSRLLQAAIDFARAQGCARITLLTDHDNAAAQRFYGHHGFVGSPMVPLRLIL